MSCVKNHTCPVRAPLLTGQNKKVNLGMLVRKGIGWDLLPTPSLVCFIFFFCSLSILSQPHAIPNVWVGYSNA